MRRFPGACSVAPALAGIFAALASYHYFEPAHQNLSVAQVRPDPTWQAEVVRAESDESQASDSQPDRSVTLKANALGHFSVTADINGMPVEMMTDTGATYVALTFKTALSLGLQPSELPFIKKTETANGTTAVAPVVLDEVRIGEIVVRHVDAVVTAPGRLRQNLLGMSFINRLSRFEMSGQQLTLTQ
ncbi:retropepsin-like aspartic protease family protein [Dichotomicrobium thermohalophilum]|uniref:Aspartyl protease family protein n=1 Tax=Dichotomicrobium thermohalophilum TaxID=933063 RepID=A0A397PHU2_9HYPH|nr:TIGR02281 family clan AA aspartic protease [Dichotomicrobium thermohalophilum]RIA47449.1 aspartyl protease family protein [Dichotomicrobium thermohalophilum]